MEMDSNSLPNDEKAILAYLNKHHPGKPGELSSWFIGDLLDHALEYLQSNPLTSIEDIPKLFTSFGLSEDVAAELSSDLVDWVYETLLDRYQRKADEKLQRFSNRGANRAKYVHEPLFEWYEVKTTKGERTGNWRWKFNYTLRSFGLLAQVVNHLHGPQEVPVAMAVLAETPKKKMPGAKRADDDFLSLRRDAFRAMLRAEVAVSGYRLAWNRGSPGWNILLKTFAKAVDMSAYCHSLNAPIIPEGFHAEVPVTFTKVVSRTGVDLKTDGSGLYHPDTPWLQSFIARYGLAPFQLRVLEPKSGLFAKGIVFPSEDAVKKKTTTTTIIERWDEKTQSWIEESSAVR